MTNHNNLTSDILKNDFDNHFEYITNGSEKIPFSAERILTDLILSGIRVYDALDILYKAKPQFEKGMPISKIIQIINKLIINSNYDESKLIRGQFQPLVIEYETYEELLSYKSLKELVSDFLNEYEYSSTTFQAIVDEFYRILRSIRSNRFKVDNIKKLIPSTIRTILGFDPFDKKNIDDMYRKVRSQFNRLSNDIQYIPDYDKIDIFLNIFEIILQLILINFNYLSGPTIESTNSQISKLVRFISSNNDYRLNQSEAYKIGKIADKVVQLNNSPTEKMITKYNWLTDLNSIYKILNKLMKMNSIKWVLITDKYDRELYTKFSRKSSKKYRNLLSMALSGIQQMINEVTNDQVTVIEQKDGVIFIEKRADFTVILFSKIFSESIQEDIKSFAKTVEENVLSDIKSFKGNVTKIEYRIDPIVNEKLLIQ